MKVVLDELEDIGWKIYSRSNFHPTRAFFIQNDFFFFCYGRSKTIQHFIQHFFCMFDEMLDEELRVPYEKFSGLQHVHSTIYPTFERSFMHKFKIKIN